MTSWILLPLQKVSRLPSSASDPISHTLSHNSNKVTRGKRRKLSGGGYILLTFVSLLTVSYSPTSGADAAGVVIAIGFSLRDAVGWARTESGDYGCLEGVVFVSSFLMM